MGRVAISGIAGTGGTSSIGKNDEGYLPKGSGESGIIGDSADREGWRGGYKLSSSLGTGRSFSEMTGDPLPPGNSVGGCMATPFDARCGGFEGSTPGWESRVSDVNVTVGHAASSCLPALEPSQTNY